MSEPEKIEYTFEQAVDIVRTRRKNLATSNELPNKDNAVMFALLQEIEKHQTSPTDQDGDLLVNLGDMRGFTLESLKEIMGGNVDNNHEAMVEEHIKVFNYAITQGIHPGQALFACVQAIGSLLGFAIRSGMSQQVAMAMTALLIRTSQQAATDVQIVTSN